MREHQHEHQHEHQRAARLTTGAAGLLLLNYPLMSAFARSARVFGVPLLWVYLLALWGLLITLLVLVVHEPADPGMSRQSELTRARADPGTS